MPLRANPHFLRFIVAVAAAFFASLTNAATFIAYSSQAGDGFGGGQSATITNPMNASVFEWGTPSSGRTDIQIDEFRFILYPLQGQSNLVAGTYDAIAASTPQASMIAYSISRANGGC
jgi:hypothetical protein